MSETMYVDAHRHGVRLTHKYGPNVHILADAWMLSIVARLSHPDTKAPVLHTLLDTCYRRLLEAAAEQLPTIRVDAPTRMTAGEPRARFVGRVVDPESRVVVVDIARAGMVPAHLTQMGLLDVLSPDAVRVDHVFMDRVSDPVTGHVTGVAFHGSKIGGPVDGATLVFPDPMGATGRSLCKAIEHYADRGKPRKIIALHLIVTPEYLAHVTKTFPDVVVYALRVDRGLSSPDVLDTMPGERWAEEKGLNGHDYIVPGAGGLGELLNNAFV